MSKTYSSRELIKRLKKDGWKLDRVRGDHYQFKHPEIKGTVTIQHPTKDLSKFIVKSIFKQAKWI
ncbi:MAG: type II toxin-antitoxin system HicA family toxin [Gammaproteobacteria bacterium]|jgi:predicted RNA binding protein YcfA (HicA-like mRNA interferase family)